MIVAFELIIKCCFLYDFSQLQVPDVSSFVASTTRCCDGDGDPHWLIFFVPRLQYHPSECCYECPLGFECDVLGLEDLDNSKCKFCCLIMFDVF